MSYCISAPFVQLGCEKRKVHSLVVYYARAIAVVGSKVASTLGAIIAGAIFPLGLDALGSYVV